MSNYMWYEATASSDEKDKIKELGFCFADDNMSDVILFNEQYEYELVRMYVSDGHGIVDVDVDNFYFAKGFPLGEERSGTTLTINAIEPMTTPVKSFKIRMTDKYPGAQWFYFAPDQEDVLLADDTWMYLYEPDGSPAQEIYYRGMEFEALNPIQSEDYEYSRFDGVEFGFRLHGGVGQLRIKFDSVVDNAGGEWSYGKRIRVLVTEPAAPSIPMGGVLTATSDSVIRVPVEQAGGVIEEYVPPVVLPTVSGEMAIMHNNPVTISAGQTNSDFYYSSTGQPVAYDSTKSYAVRRARDAVPGGNDINPTVFALVDSSGELAVKNISSSSVTVEFINVSVCSSNLATVIIVYDSNNSPYNAFQYTSDGTDYYYVLDGTQTDWTDDLSSIGYHMIYTAWLKADHTTKANISNMEWYDLYDDNGQLITSGFPDPFTSHSFMVVSVYRGDNVVPCTYNQFDISTGHLKVNMNVGGKSVQYITYMVSPTA